MYSSPFLVQLSFREIIRDDFANVQGRWSARPNFIGSDLDLHVSSA